MYLFAILSTTSKINARTDAQDAPPRKCLTIVSIKTFRFAPQEMPPKSLLNNKRGSNAFLHPSRYELITFASWLFRYSAKVLKKIKTETF